MITTLTLTRTPHSDVRHEMTHTQFVLPRRCDVHQVEHITSTLVELAGPGEVVRIDGSAVEMIDHAALDALSAIARSVDVGFEAPSVALLATFRYTGSDLLASCCESATMLEAA